MSKKNVKSGKNAKTGNKERIVNKAKNEKAETTTVETNSGITLEQAIPEFLDYLKEQGKNERTVEVYGRCLDNVSAFFSKEKPITKLTPMNIGQFLKSDAYLKKPNGVDRSPITRTQISRVLRMMLSWAVEKSYIPEIPLPKSEMKIKSEKCDAKKSSAPCAENMSNEQTVEETQEMDQ